MKHGTYPSLISGLRKGAIVPTGCLCQLNKLLWKTCFPSPVSTKKIEYKDGIC